MFFVSQADIIIRSGRYTEIYAIVESGGKQYRVSPGQQVKVDLLPAEEGAKIDLEKVLLLADDDTVMVGKPTVEGALVKATVKGNGRSGKIAVFKYKSKTRYSKLTGHRQGFTTLGIDEIVAPGAEKKPAPAKKASTRKTTATRKPRAKKEVTEDGS